MPRERINLSFYCYPPKNALPDFCRVAERITSAAPDIRARAYTTKTSLDKTLGTILAARSPSLSIEMDRLKLVRPLRGVRLRHERYGKVHQLEMLEAAGLPVPKWTPVTPSTRLDPAEWGPYVVVKPVRGKRGAYVWVTRTARVRYKQAEEYPPNHPGKSGGMLAQRFVYTGRWPVAYRVLTYLGRPLSATLYHGKRDQPALEAAFAFREKGGGRSIVANALGSTISCTDDPEVLALAVRAHAAFPTIPSLGVDIIREQETGTLYVLEVNPSGNSWSFTCEAGRAMQVQFGLDFYSQFGALDIIAEASIEAARRLAG